MLGMIIALSVMGVAFTVSSVMMAIKLRDLNRIVAMLTMMVVDGPNTTHFIKNGEDVYDVKFPSSEGF